MHLIKNKSLYYTVLHYQIYVIITAFLVNIVRYYNFFFNLKTKYESLFQKKFRVYLILKKPRAGFCISWSNLQNGANSGFADKENTVITGWSCLHFILAVAINLFSLIFIVIWKYPEKLGCTLEQKYGKKWLF